MAINFAPRRFTSGTISSSSSLDPEHVAALDHPEVAVARLRRMHEVGGRSGARQRGGDLARDVTRLADPADDDAAAASVDQRHGGEEALVEAPDQPPHRVGLDGKHPPGDIERARRAVQLFFRRGLYHCGQV